MIIISEYTLTKDLIQIYRRKGYSIYYGYEEPKIKKGESVGFLLDNLYKSTMDRINSLLYTHHKVTLKYKDKVYHLSSLDEWHYSYQSDKDMLKTKSKCHEIYALYLEKRSEYYEQQSIKKEKEKYETLYKNFNIETLPNDDELDNFVRTFSRFYQMDVDYSDKYSMITSYIQLNYYLDNDIPYANEPGIVDIEDEPMFNLSQFKVPPYEEPTEVTYFGDEIYMEDFMYKNSCNLN